MKVLVNTLGVSFVAFASPYAVCHAEHVTYHYACARLDVAGFVGCRLSRMRIAWEAAANLLCTACICVTLWMRGCYSWLLSESGPCCLSSGQLAVPRQRWGAAYCVQMCPYAPVWGGVLHLDVSVWLLW